MTTFGERFKLLRKEKNLTQEQLSNMFFTTKASISRYESNIHVPEIDTLKKYAEFYNVTIDYLLGLSDIRTTTDEISDAVKNDPELCEFWDMLKDREDLQILFKQTKKLDSKGIQQIIRIIKAIEDEEDNE